MNPLLQRLHPYPFERLRELARGIVPPPGLRAIGHRAALVAHPDGELRQRAAQAPPASSQGSTGVLTWMPMAAATNTSGNSLTCDQAI